jgi:predicted acylesterase/phospholipase RssA
MTIPIQLAIQGGGARITYLIAALEAVQSLEREGVLRVTRIAGTSAGAIAGALYGAGIDMQRARDAFEAHREELLRAFPRTEASLRATWCVLTRRPLWDAEPLRRLLAKLLSPHERLGDLAVPLVIVATDLTNMQPCVYRNAGEPLLSSLLDSAGIPFFFRTAPTGHAAYRVIVDGGVCENLPCDQLDSSEEQGKVVGISFAASRSDARPGRSMSGSLGFLRALFETALNASELRSHLALGANNFVIRTGAGTFDFQRAFTTGLGAEYRETRLLAEEFFRSHVERASGSGTRGEEERPGDDAAASGFPVAQLPQVIGPLRNWYRHQERTRFEMLSVRMVITAASPLRGIDDVRHEIVFRPSESPIHCYKINLVSPWSPLSDNGRCEVFDRSCEPVPCDRVSVTERIDQPRELLLLFHEPIVPGDERAPFTLRVRDTIPAALGLGAEGRDELLIDRAARADRPIASVQIIVHLPEELAATAITASPGSTGARMTPSELMRHAAPAGFTTLGWKGTNVPPDASFGCCLIRR